MEHEYHSPRTAAFLRHAEEGGTHCCIRYGKAHVDSGYVIIIGIWRGEFANKTSSDDSSASFGNSLIEIGNVTVIRRHRIV